MSKDYYVDGFKPPDEKWKKMKAVWDSCYNAGIKIPQEVREFFENEHPDDAGVKVDLKHHECCTEIVESGDYGFEVDLTELPEGVTKIRFTINS